MSIFISKYIRSIQRNLCKLRIYTFPSVYLDLLWTILSEKYIDFNSKFVVFPPLAFSISVNVCYFTLKHFNHIFFFFFKNIPHSYIFLSNLFQTKPFDSMEFRNCYCKIIAIQSRCGNHFLFDWIFYKSSMKFGYRYCQWLMPLHYEINEF